eukprot:CAMPEP_0182455368 /NCGR_PEP_ID=MMETSP1319-20130603/1564_1 /TAXON_ID=172717 /ORGANISM="Bolidomonas pacifica, Strain RCC208" /LENGTH=108 /DNA_ID=CAMNT_0024653417 /DNA_START=82 /DNA_END=408 /DNA_ORIENTATION=+
MSTRMLCAQANCTGTVKFFNARKGWGFIAVDGKEEERDADVFVHQIDIRRDGFRFLDAGERVSFSIDETSRGRAAREVSSEDGSVLPYVPRETRFTRDDHNRYDSDGY